MSRRYLVITELFLLTKGGTAVLHEQTGLRVDGANTEAVAQALMRLLRDDHLRAGLSEAAQARAHAELGWEKVAEKTANLRLINSEEV